MSVISQIEKSWDKEVWGTFSGPSCIYFQIHAVVLHKDLISGNYNSKRKSTLKVIQNSCESYYLYVTDKSIGHLHILKIVYEYYLVL